jgi:ligand-binding sensor domain-containing protein/signal transduction histidine kinase
MAIPAVSKILVFITCLAHNPGVLRQSPYVLTGHIVLWLLGILPSLSLWGQFAKAEADLSQSNSFVCHTWRVEDGLPHNTVMAITQTRDGYLWLGTANGLARFDGVQFKRFGLTDGLSSLYVRVLLEDREGVLWIGTVNGLSRYLNGRFTTWTTREGLAGNVILALTEDLDGGIWVGTNTGLSRWRKGAFETMGLQAGISARYVAALAADRRGAVWVSVNGVGLLRWDAGAFTTMTNLPGTSSAVPSRILQDRAGRIWAGTVGHVFCLEGAAWKEYGPGDGLPKVGIMSLAEGSDGTIWAGTFDEALFYLREGKFHGVAQSDGLSDTSILAIMEDREKDLWVGTRAGGLNRLKPRQVSMWCHMEDGVEVPPMSLTEDRAGVVLMASQGRGVYQFDSRGRMQFVREPLQSLPNSLPLGRLLSARDGSLWWGSVSRLSQWQEGNLVASYSSTTELRRDSVRCLWEDRDNGMWIGTRDGRLLLLRDGVLTAFTNGLPGGMFTSVVQQSDGTVWIGSYGGGLGRLKNGIGTTFGRAQGLRSDLIRALCLDSQTNLWIGTEGGGLSCLEDGAIQSFGAQQGMGDDTILQILESDDGDLWLGTYHGIFQIIRRDLQALLAGRTSRVHPRGFGRSDGLLSEQCVAGSGTCLKRRNGQLCFSTDRGIAVIDPKARWNPNLPPDVRVEGVWVDGKSQPLPDAQPELIKGGHESPAELVIPPGLQRFEFQYTGLHFSAPEKVRFRYRLEGLDSDWVDAGAQRVAYYSYVQPGSYRFQVAAHTGNGVWSEAGAAAGLKLTILPYFWQTWWFRLAGWLGAVVLGSGTVVAVIRRRHSSRLEAVERRGAVERERSRIAQDMHDDLGSSLTEIGFLSTLVRNQALPGPEGELYLAQITEKSRELVKTLDEIVWAVNPRNDSLSNTVNYLCLFAEELLQAAAIRCRLDVPVDLPRKELNAEQRHNLFLAVKEALANAARHSNASEILLRFELASNLMTITVQDNGCGFDPVRVEPGRNGLANLQTRMTKLGGQCEITAVPGGGSAVRLGMPVS